MKAMVKKQKGCAFQELLKPYENKWVALSNDRKKIIADGDKLKDIVSVSKSKDVIFLKVFPSGSFYMPTTHEV